ncbi:hypothetical protein BRADO2761 [Bradyrhizobium sp. ORS 278]|nr:hypothetical protein BRADO2761 [Bradyrhizobium sp. ORS 278]
MHSRIIVAPVLTASRIWQQHALILPALSVAAAVFDGLDPRVWLTIACDQRHSAGRSWRRVERTEIRTRRRQSNEAVRTDSGGIRKQSSGALRIVVAQRELSREVVRRASFATVCPS